jgi:antitoxin PrlF
MEGWPLNADSIRRRVDTAHVRPIINCAQSNYTLLLIKCRATSHGTMEVTLSSKNQVTIPKVVREYLRLKPGDRFRFFFQSDGAVVILPLIPTSALKGSVPKSSRPVSVEQMDAAIKAGATKRFR